MNSIFSSKPFSALYIYKFNVSRIHKIIKRFTWCVYLYTPLWFFIVSLNPFWGAFIKRQDKRKTTGRFTGLVCTQTLSETLDDWSTFWIGLSWETPSLCHFYCFLNTLKMRYHLIMVRMEDFWVTYPKPPISGKWWNFLMPFKSPLL